MVIEQFEYERTDQANGKIRLDDIRSTASPHREIIWEKYGGGTPVSQAPQFLALYLDGTLQRRKNNKVVEAIRGRAVHVAYTSEVELGSTWIEVSPDTPFYFFGVGSLPPSDPNYRDLPDEIGREMFENLKRDNFVPRDRVDSSSSSRTKTHRQPQNTIN